MTWKRLIGLSEGEGIGQSKPFSVLLSAGQEGISEKWNAGQGLGGGQDPYSGSGLADFGVTARSAGAVLTRQLATWVWSLERRFGDVTS